MSRIARRDERRRLSPSPEAEQLDDVRVTLDALEDLLLHLEPHLVLAGHAASAGILSATGRRSVVLDSTQRSSPRYAFAKRPEPSSIGLPFSSTTNA